MDNIQIKQIYTLEEFGRLQKQNHTEALISCICATRALHIIHCSARDKSEKCAGVSMPMKISINL